MNEIRLLQVATIWCMRPKDFAKAYGVTVQTLAHWRVHRTDGPIWIKEGGVILYPIEDNIERLRNLPRRKSTADNGDTGCELFHPLVTEITRPGVNHMGVTAS